MRPSHRDSRRAGGRYVLGELLGRGGMAEVFSGHSIGDHGFQKPVAIKRLLPELANDEVFVERLIGEAKLLVGMQHGNIVSVLDLARDGDDVFLVMEFVDGPSLRQLLKARGQRGLPLGVSTYILQAAAAGLEFAHARPGGAIIHADISPSNLLLTTSGEVRVADFGIARREGGGHGVVEGKWAYMAPEQARGEPLTPRSDVFALGVVLYELICGAHPFGRQVTAEERDSEPLRVIPPRVVRPSIPPGIDAICMRALAHDPRDRYARMQHLIDAIVEERFANNWREGASDLAHAIRECSPQDHLPQPRTMVTDRPLTIMTRSLLRELTPRRARSPRLETPPPVEATPPPVCDSGAQTNAILVEDVVRAAALAELPPNLRADGTPMPPFRLPEVAMPGQDLASVIGGHTVTGASVHLGPGAPERSSRWAIGVLAAAAVIGVIAAIVMQLAPTPPVTDEPEPPVAELQAPAATSEDGREALPPTVTTVDPPAVLPPVRDTADPVDPPPATTAPASAPDTTEAPATTDTIEVTDATDTTDATETTKTTDTTAEDGPAVPAKAAPEVTERPDTRRRPARVVRRRKPGILRVNADPWAWVYIAGQRRLDTPAKFTLSPGKYTVRLADEGGRSITKYVVVESGKTKTLAVNMDEDF